jgi:hypothetical protein
LLQWLSILMYNVSTQGRVCVVSKEYAVKIMSMILLLTLVTSGAIAETYVTSGVIPQQTTSWHSFVWLEQFNPARGELESMTVTVGGALIGEFRHEITGTTPGSWSDEMTVTLHASLNDEVIIIFDGAYAAEGNLSPYDGFLDFEGNSGATHPFSIPLAGGVTRSTGFGSYVGTGTIPIQVIAHSNASLSQSRSGTMESSATCGATVSISYVYTPAAVANENASWSDVKTLFR